MSSNTCCFCFERRTGCIIIGVLSLLSNISVILRDVKGTVAWERIIPNMILAVGAILLLVGIFQERHELLKASLIIRAAGIFFLLFILILAVVATIIEGGFRDLLFEFILVFILVVVETYFFYVVYKHYKDMKSSLPV